MAISWKGVLWAGLLAGFGFILLQMLLFAWFTDAGPWSTPRLVATMALGPGAAPPPAGFEPGAVAVGIAIQLSVSLAAALVLGTSIAATGADLVWSVIGGALFGTLLYIIGFYVFSALFPSLEDARGAVTAFNHIVYGGALGGIYRAVSAPVEVPPKE